MILNSRNNLFDFRFNKNFVPKEIVEKYKPYLNKIPGNLFEEPIDFINYGIQGLNLPGMGFEPVEQSDNPGSTRYYRGRSPMKKSFEKQFTITMQLMDGYINYWMMTDILLYYHHSTTKQKHLDDLKLRVLDSEGLGISSITFEQPILNQISELTLNMAENISEFSTFDLNIYYNRFEIKMDID